MSHGRSANKAILMVSKKLRDPLRAPLYNWTQAFSNAILARSVRWILSLAKLASTRASELESKMAAARTNSWKVAIGAKP